jgi:two-component system nitrogen regulation response regulator GlnG
LVSDLPPELVEDSSSGGTHENWEQSLRNWTDRELGRGEKRILDLAVPAFERVMIETALKHTAGRRRDAAELLGWGRNTLTRKIKELGLDDGHSEDDE